MHPRRLPCVSHPATPCSPDGYPFTPHTATPRVPGAPLALRHGIATALLAAADADADGRLSAAEARGRAALLCAAAHELQQAGGSAVEGAAAVLLGHRWTFAQTAAAAAADEAALLARPLESLDVAEGVEVGLAFVRDAARAARRKDEV